MAGAAAPPCRPGTRAAAARCCSRSGPTLARCRQSCPPPPPRGCLQRQRRLIRRRGDNFRGQIPLFTMVTTHGLPITSSTCTQRHIPLQRAAGRGVRYERLHARSRRVPRDDDATAGGGALRLGPGGRGVLVKGFSALFLPEATGLNAANQLVSRRCRCRITRCCRTAKH
jgi:hypothetical protein